MASDATWCARCSTVVHGACLIKANEVCPTCRTAYDRPEGHFVFSRQCPECSRPNDPPQPRCRACGAATRWDTPADYNDFLAHMKDTSRVYGLRGMMELIGAAICLAPLLAYIFLFRKIPLIFPGLCLLGFMTLTADGFISLMRSRRTSKFQ
jgi:hypothetical protein